MTHRPFLLAATLLLASGLGGCGRVADLAFGAQGRVPPTPVGSTEKMTPERLNEPTTQARPKRSDELLRQSEERQSDEFDLPPA